MTQTEPSESSFEATPAISCEEAFELTRTFTAEEISTGDTKRLRRHLARCAECMANYREAVGTAAALGRSKQEEREKRAIERQRWQLHARVFGTSSAEGEEQRVKPRRRNFQLRLVLMPAIFIYIVTQITGLGPPPSRVQLVESKGRVSIDERSVDVGSDPQLVLPGRWVRTDRYAGAKLDGRTCVVDLESATDLLVESAAPPRFRLRSGGIRLEGSATVVTVLGLIEVEEGRGKLSLDDRGLAIEPVSGIWSRFDKSGEVRLENGRELVFRP